jgi:hypothetical protein
MVRVDGSGDYGAVLVSGEAGLLVEIIPPMGKPPWVVSGEIPLDTELGKTEFTATGTTLSGLKSNQTLSKSMWSRRRFHL